MTVTLNPAIVGQAEKHHTAILSRALSGTALDEKQWITVNQALAAGGTVERAAHVAHVARLTRWRPADVDAALAALVGTGLVREAPGDHIEVTDAGRALVARVRAETGEILGRAYGSVPAADLAVAARVLTTITARMAEELA
ncbi:hypothetical protein AB0O28_11535 [Microbispora sp. NPDC088329]|uniref:hypothetical protein n=1 Tax=Microbispora sp. NPDC088329 TaxID=3154869 RepID=UPI00341A6A20